MGSHVIKASDADFESRTAKGVVLVDFYAEWCGPCRMLSPIIDELARDMEGKALFVKVNTDESPNVAGRFEVTSIPTLILLKDGKVVKRVVGLRDIDELRDMINEAL